MPQRNIHFICYKQERNMCDNLDERKELISKLDTRKSMVTKLLEGELLKQADWCLIKNTSLVLDSRGQISSNSVLNNLRTLTEPVLQMFSEDLVAIRTKVTLLLSNINDDNEDIKMLVTAATEGFDINNPVVQLMTVIKVIENMNLWASQVMDNWITYHLTRNQLKEDIDVERVVADNTFQQTDDMCQALILWDCKMAKEMKSMLNTLLFHFITLEDMVLEATGSVAEIPQTPRNCSLYI